MIIKELALEDRPREKLLANGVESLKNAELLAILIGSGSRDKSAVELMQDVLDSCENRLSDMSRFSVEQLMNFKGIGEAKALTLIAAAELARRRSKESMGDRIVFDQADVVAAYMRPYVQDLDYETSWALMLNNRAQLIRRVALSAGGMTSTIVDVRMLLKEALLCGATCFILVHNHPSGSLRPSRHDHEITERVHKAAQTMDIRMLDHVIVIDSDTDYYSFAENGKL